MQKLKDAQGASQLALEAVTEVTNIVEGMYRNIAAKPMPWGQAPEGRARGIAGLVHESIRQVNAGLRLGVDATFKQVMRLVEDQVPTDQPPSAVRATALAVLNGVLGDHLAASNNPLAIDMRLCHAGWDLQLSQQALCESFPQADGKLVVLIHGLCMHEGQWLRNGHDHGLWFAEQTGATPLYLRYNSGRHISVNGCELAGQLEQLVANWPVPVSSLTLVGHSMGGLLIRAALAHADAAQMSWLGLTERAIYLGSPHHGAVLERGGNWLNAGAALSPYTAPLGALGHIRSNGITDLRHGNVQEADWAGHAEFDSVDTARQSDRRLPLPLTPGPRHYALAGTLSSEPGQVIGRLLGDGLVHPSSATGRHENPAMALDFPADQQAILRGVGHLSLLDSPAVIDQLGQWLAD